MVCPLCGGIKHKIVSTRGIIQKAGEEVLVTNVLCARCGLVFINPRPEKQEYKSLYQDYGERRHSLNTKEAIIAYINTASGGLKGERVTGFLKTYVHRGGAALDVGVGAGTIAVALKDKLGLEVQGIEPGVLLGQTVSEYCRLPVFIGLLEDYAQKFSEKKFDLIVLHHVFEHFTLPIETMKLLRQLLRPNGIVYIEVPNVLDFKKPVNQFFDLLHPFSYSPATLKRMLILGGFKIIDWNKNKHWRIQIVAAPESDPRPAVANSAFDGRYTAWRTKWFLYWRHLNDYLTRLIS
jgi:2-polyprenyl-3-methyl-5-hydroxy-6-metoxy-1,4-benzoquinol methylase